MKSHAFHRGRRSSVRRGIEALELRTLLSIAPAGSEFHVNTTTAGNQLAPATAADADGDFVVAWTDLSQEGASNAGIFARRYNSSGTALSGEIHVNTYTTGAQSDPTVGIDSDGDFVIAWSSFGEDGSSSGIYAQRFNSSGARISGEFRVNSTTTGSQGTAAIAMDANGDFVIAWGAIGQTGGSEQDVYAQRFDHDANKVGPEFLVNSTTTNKQNGPAVAMDLVGDFVITWQSYLQDGSGYGIYARRYNSSGAAQGGEFPVNSFTSDFQRAPSIAMDASGDFVIAWSSYGEDGSYYGIYARRYNAAGAVQGGEIPVNSFVSGSQQNPSVAMDQAGNFTVAWETAYEDNDSYGIYALRYNAAGTEQPRPTGTTAGSGNEFRVNTFTAGSQFNVMLVSDFSGDLVAVYASDGQEGDSGIFGQRYHETTDTARPLVGGAFVNGTQIEPYQVYAPNLTAIVVSFSENMSTSGGASGANSVVNPANYLVTANGVDVTPGSVAFALNATTNRYEATLTLASSYPSGNFLIEVKDSLHDIAGNQLDGDVNNTAGGFFLMPFEIGPTGLHGGEFRVNGVTAQVQQSPAVAMDPAGDFVIVFDTEGPFSGPLGTYLVSEGLTARRYNALGQQQGSDISISSALEGHTSRPAVAMDANGDFIVVATAYQSGGSITSIPYDIYAQRFDAAGNPGTPFLVNSLTTGDQFAPAIAMDSAGDFVIAWSSYVGDASANVYARRFNAGGTPLGADFALNANTTDTQGAPAVAMDSAGDFVVTWLDYQADPSSGGIFARRFNSSGAALGAPFRVNTVTTGQQDSPSVAMDSAGDFAVVWQNFGSYMPGGYGISAQRYNAAGSALGGEFVVGTTTSIVPFSPSVAMDSAGDFVVTWSGVNPYDNSSGRDIYARRYNSSAVAQGNDFKLNTYTTSNQELPVVAMASAGDWVAAWQSDGQDGDSYGIYAQRYGIDQAPVTGALADSPDPVNAGDPLSLIASSVTDDVGAASVSFYRESNGLPGLQVGASGDTFVGSTSMPVSNIWVTAISTGSLAPGTYTYYAQAMDTEGLTGVPATTANTVTPPPPPVVSNSAFLYLTLPLTLSFTFDHDVSASNFQDPSISSYISVQDLTHSTIVNPNHVSYNSGTHILTFTLVGTLADANYRATLKHAAILNGTTPMSADYVLNFFAFAGDANHDRIVDIRDFSALAANMNTSGKNFAQGDFNYDTLVNSIDLGIMARHWQQSLSPPPPGLAGSTTTGPPRRTATRVAETVLE